VASCWICAMSSGGAAAGGAGAAACGAASWGCCAADMRLDVRLDVRLATLLAGIMSVLLLRSSFDLPLSPRVRGGERLGLLAGDEPDLDEVERADEARGDGEAAGTEHRVAERDHPRVLEQDQRGGGVVREVL